MRKSVLSSKQQKQWQKLYSAAINGNPPWKKDFGRFSEKYSKLMKEKLVILEKWSKEEDR